MANIFSFSSTKTRLLSRLNKRGSDNNLKAFLAGFFHPTPFFPTSRSRGPFPRLICRHYRPKPLRGHSQTWRDSYWPPWVIIIVYRYYHHPINPEAPGSWWITGLSAFCPQIRFSSSPCGRNFENRFSFVHGEERYISYVRPYALFLKNPTACTGRLAIMLQSWWLSGFGCF